MKTLVAMMTLVAFVVFASAAIAEDKAPAKKAGEQAKPATTVNCCVKGECKQVGSKADCDKQKGSVVKECSSCK